MNSLLVPVLLSLASTQANSQTTVAAKSAPIEVRLTPMVSSDTANLRWSPKGSKLPLKAVGDELHGTLELGHASFSIVLSRHGTSKHIDKLWIDHNRDGERTANEVSVTEGVERRGKIWASFKTLIELELADNKSTRPYPLALWFVADPSEPEIEPALRWSRSGWHQGEVTLEGEPAFVLITEMSMNGLFDETDSWSLSRDKETFVAKAGSRTMTKHAWLADSAYRMVAVCPDGMWVRIEPYDPGITRAEEERLADVYAVDRNAKRAQTPLAFSHDFGAAAAQAIASKKPLLIDFETTWCGPCKQMDSWVYTSQKVVNAAKTAGIIAVKVDGDQHKQLKQRFKVEAYPTVIVLSAEGVEVRRKVGYLGVEDMARFLHPSDSK
ncbi:MAG: thiol-disulfide isomerase/thioredoxin [Planctomycetota bacterium]|jgi:thiol-disulfide isomerase/thioredoxin